GGLESGGPCIDGSLRPGMATDPGKLTRVEHRPPARAHAVAPMAMPALLEAMRPRQWSKNVFVLAGIVFAGRLFDRSAQLRVLACFALFCAAASAVYLVNDVADRKSDAHHPAKRDRPIASGRLAPGVAVAAAIALAVCALAGAAALNRATLGI